MSQKVKSHDTVQIGFSLCFPCVNSVVAFWGARWRGATENSLSRLKVLLKKSRSWKSHSFEVITVIIELIYKYCRKGSCFFKRPNWVLCDCVTLTSVIYSFPWRKAMIVCFGVISTVRCSIHTPTRRFPIHPIHPIPLIAPRCYIRLWRVIDYYCNPLKFHQQMVIEFSSNLMTYSNCASNYNVASIYDVASTCNIASSYGVASTYDVASA